MGYYGQNVDAILRMGTATATSVADLPSAASDTLREVPLTQVTTPPVREKNVGSFNVLNDSDTRSIGGKKAAQTCEGTIVLDHDEQVHQDMIDDANADGAVYRNWQLEYPDGWTQDWAGFISRLADAPFDATGDAAEHKSEYRISVSGNVAEAMNTP
jgi:hypothetical protein